MSISKQVFFKSQTWTKSYNFTQFLAYGSEYSTGTEFIYLFTTNNRVFSLFLAA